MSQSITPGTGPESLNAPRPRSSKSKWPLVLLLLVLIGGGAGWYYYSKSSKASTVSFRTATVGTGEIVQEVTANGSLNAVKSVEVGAQVSGIIQKIHADFNTKVNAGDIVAEIEPSTYQKNLQQAQAQLSVSKAGLELAEVNYRRAKELFKNNLISASEHDTTLAALHQAEATVRIQEASVERAKVDLSYTVIHAPIEGVVISRSVDEGQTVASSFNTPRLFVIAKDLTKMQIEAAVSEADVGGVEEGQTVSFSVEAFQNRRFRGLVQQVRYAPITNQNVVTYTAVVQVENPDLKLRPGMTATARIITAQRSNVLRIPNAALRFKPPATSTPTTATNRPSATGTNQTAPAVATDSTGMPIPPWRAENRRPTPEEREKFEASLTPEQRDRYREMMQQMRQAREGGGGGNFGGGGGGGAGGTPRARQEGPSSGTVYLVESSGAPAAKPVLKPVTIKTGITDGNFTEVLDGLKEGDVLATGLVTAGTATTAEPPRNPFMPFGGGPPRR